MKKRLLGGIFILIGAVLILNSLSGITGFVVIEDVKSNTGGIFGIVLLIAGFLLFFSVESDLRRREKLLGKLEQISTGGGIGGYKELIRIARSMGYTLREGSRHVEVYAGKRRITGIPRHNEKRTATGTYKTIVKELINGYSSIEAI